MNEFREMARSYEHSIDLLKGRIDEISLQIGGLRADGEALGKLVDRRYKLYQEIWELQGSLRSILEYIDAVERRGGSKECLRTSA